MASSTSSQNVAGPSSHSSDTVDPITKFKILVPHLKESLQVTWRHSLRRCRPAIAKGRY